MSQPNPNRPYSLFLVVTDRLLIELAAVLAADYVPGTFEQVCDAFYESDRYEVDWEMRGEHGWFNVFIERYEGYLLCSLRAVEPFLSRAKTLMWERYLAAGGNPDRASPP